RLEFTVEAELDGRTRPMWVAESEGQLLRAIERECEACGFGEGELSRLVEPDAALPPVQFGCDVEIDPDPLVVVEIDGFRIPDMVLHTGTVAACEAVVERLILFEVPRFQREVIDDPAVWVLGAANVVEQGALIE